jgi:hypothetical protein
MFVIGRALAPGDTLLVGAGERVAAVALGLSADESCSRVSLRRRKAHLRAGASPSLRSQARKRGGCLLLALTRYGIERANQTLCDLRPGKLQDAAVLIP